MKKSFERKLVVRASDLISVLNEVEITRGTGMVYLQTTLDREYFAFYCIDDRDVIFCSDAKEAAYYGIGVVSIGLTSEEAKILFTLAESLTKIYGDKALIVFHDEGEVGYLNSTLEEEIEKANRMIFKELTGGNQS